MRHLSTAFVVGGLALVAVGMTAARAETIDVQPILLCPPEDALCGYSDLEAIRKVIRRGFIEVNLEYSHVPLSFHPLEAWIIVDPDLSALAGTSGNGYNGMPNDDIADLIGSKVKTSGAIALYLLPDVNPSFAGLPCPNGSAQEARRQAVRNGVFANVGGGGGLWAHELGHYWCLPHTHTRKDEPEFAPCSGTCGKNEVDDDPDAHACPQLPPVLDTDPDPGLLLKWKEGMSPTSEKKADTKETDGSIKDQHRWCDAPPEKPADPGSPHATWCGEASCMQNRGGLFVAIPETPLTEVTMSYYHHAGHCRGPFVVKGHRTEAFTEDQSARILACRERVGQRGPESLPDRCKGKGDGDHDGWCDDEDNCPSRANTMQTDWDHDGIGTLCDGCDMIPGDGGGDTDGDHFGDLCDMDIDGDGCFNCDPSDKYCHDEAASVGVPPNDQHPLDADPDVGFVVMPMCSPATGTASAWEGNDSDGDLVPDCADADDDDDGTPDEKDPCPIVKGTEALLCTEFRAGCGLLAKWEAICELGGCNELELTVESINPDPTTVARFPTFRIARGVVYLAPLADRTLGESAEALRGAMSFAGGRLPGEVLAMVLRDVRSGALVDTLARWVIDDVRLSDTLTPRALAVRIDGHELDVRGTWGLGIEPGAQLSDVDGDGVPDTADACLVAWDPDQADGDADGFGDACDADVDGDRFIDERDEELVLSCFGVDVSEPAIACDDDVGTLDPELTEKPCDIDPKRSGTSSALLERCAPADLDHDGIVGELDRKAVASDFGNLVGPSGLSPASGIGCDFAVTPPRCELDAWR